MTRLLLLATFTGILAGCTVDKDSTTVFLAKEMCSCRFLVEQSESNCLGAIRIALAAGDVAVDYANKKVTATSEDKSKTATFRFVSPKFGCEPENI